MSTSGGKRAGEIRDALDNPRPAPILAAPGDVGPELGDGSRSERPPFPPGGVVVPLGISSGLDGSQKCFYINYNGQVIPLEAGNKHGKLGLCALYGPQSDWLEANWPQWSKPVYEGRGAARILVSPSEIVGFDQAEAARAHVEECARRGIFDTAGKLRGAGGHRQRGGGLVLHCGDKLYLSRHHVDGTLRDFVWVDPGLRDGFVYTAAAKLPRPHHEPAHPECAIKLLALLRTWKWKRELIDPRLLLGGIGASMIGGALRWRPNIWITGRRGTGKSTLNGENGVLDELFGEAQFRTGNASAASIRQSLQNSTIPVNFDEIEASADNRRALETVELARIASSGTKMHRGGQDHTAHEFTLRSCFWFSSINMPPLQPQDRSRLAILELLPLPKGAVPPDLDSYHLPELGKKLLRRMVDGWPRLEATKGRFHAALSAAGHDNRACDQFGTLLACADLLLEDHDTPDQLPDQEEVDDWASVFRPDRMAEIADETPDHIEALQHILTSEVQARGGDEREALGNWIGKAVAYVVDPHLEQSHPRAGDDRSGRRLEQKGLKLVNAVWKPGVADKPGHWGTRKFALDAPGFLAVANSHRALAALYRDTRWQSGVWKQALGRCAGAIEGVSAVKFGPVPARAVLVPLWHVLEDEDLPPGSQRGEAEAWLQAMRGASEE